METAFSGGDILKELGMTPQELYAQLEMMDEKRGRLDINDKRYDMRLDDPLKAEQVEGAASLIVEIDATVITAGVENPQPSRVLRISMTPDGSEVLGMTSEEVAMEEGGSDARLRTMPYLPIVEHLDSTSLVLSFPGAIDAIREIAEADSLEGQLGYRLMMVMGAWNLIKDELGEQGVEAFTLGIKVKAVLDDEKRRHLENSLERVELHEEIQFDQLRDVFIEAAQKMQRHSEIFFSTSINPWNVIPELRFSYQGEEFSITYSSHDYTVRNLSLGCLGNEHVQTFLSTLNYITGREGLIKKREREIDQAQRKLGRLSRFEFFEKRDLRRRIEYEEEQIAHSRREIKEYEESMRAKSERLGLDIQEGILGAIGELMDKIRIRDFE